MTVDAVMQMSAREFDLWMVWYEMQMEEAKFFHRNAREGKPAEARPVRPHTKAEAIGLLLHKTGIKGQLDAEAKAAEEV